MFGKEPQRVLMAELRNRVTSGEWLEVDMPGHAEFTASELHVNGKYIRRFARVDKPNRRRAAIAATKKKLGG